MVSDITGLDYEILKDNIILETNELPIDTKNEKVKICDFILKIDKDNIINLELNRQSHTGMIIKNLSYLFKIFSLSFKRGEKYNDNLIITQININCFKNELYPIIKPLSKYHIREDETNNLYVKNLVIYDLNIVKCHEIYYNKNNTKEVPNYIKWGTLIYCNNFMDMENIISELLTIKERKKFMDNLKKLTREDLFYTEEEALEWAEWERKTIISDAEEKGLKQGIEKNTKETILSMLENNLSLELISKVTNKSIDEINQIIN